jgi:hypothetical protein
MALEEVILLVAMSDRTDWKTGSAPRFGEDRFLSSLGRSELSEDGGKKTKQKWRGLSVVEVERENAKKSQTMQRQKPTTEHSPLGNRELR